MFQGASSLSLDAKGRLSVPTRHRERLGTQITVTRHPHGYLMLFPRTAWEEFSGRVAGFPMEAQWWKRIFLGNAMDVEVDASGRVLLPPELREAVGIARDTRDVLLLGMNSHLELWDKATHDAKEAEALQGAMPDAIKGFSI